MLFSQDRTTIVPEQAARYTGSADERLAVGRGVGHKPVAPRRRPAQGPESDDDAAPPAWGWHDPRAGEPEAMDLAVGGDQAYREIADGLAIAPSVTVVLPVKNEAANLPDVFATIPGWVDEIVLVDGRSTDDTIEVARRLRPDVKVVMQGGVGKGDALLAGFAAATGEIIVTIDGDGSTDGREIVRFVGALVAGADFAKGSRFNSAGASDDITVIRRCGNKVLNLTVNRLFGTGYSDLCYGFNAFWARHLDKLALDCPGFEVETLMSIRAARAGLSIHEVPSHERPRLHGSSNLSAVRDGSRILRLIVAERRAARRRRGPKPFLAPGHLLHGHQVPWPHGHRGQGAAGHTANQNVTTDTGANRQGENRSDRYVPGTNRSAANGSGRNGSHANGSHANGSHANGSRANGHRPGGAGPDR